MQLTGITDTNEDISIKITSPNEFRALYILLKLVAHPDFKPIRDATKDFDKIPALGPFCIQDISGNPVKAIYKAMTGGHGIKPSKSRLEAIIRACKVAIRNYNTLLSDFFNSGLVTYGSCYKLPSTFIKSIVDRDGPYTEEEFKTNIIIKTNFSRLSDEEIDNVWKKYEEFSLLFARFGSIDPNRAVAATRLIDAFKDLSVQIAADSYMLDDTVDASGIVTDWYRCDKWHMTPSTFAFMTTMTAGILFAQGQMLLAPYIMLQLTPGSALATGLFGGYGTLLFNRRSTQWKVDRDDAYMAKAIDKVAADIPAYKQLLTDKGYPFNEVKPTEAIEDPAENTRVTEPLLGMASRS